MTTPLRLVGFSGGLRSPSRTTALVQAVARTAGRRREVVFELYDLDGMGPGLGARSRRELPSGAQEAIEAIERADALIVGTPIYKGSYSGLFKHLVDFIEPMALVGVPVALTATGGGRRHALAVEHQLRPLFAFFSALTLPTAVCASDEDFSDSTLTDDGVLARVEQVAQELAEMAVARRRTVPAQRLERVA